MSPGPSLVLELPAVASNVAIGRHAVAELCDGTTVDHGAVALAVTEAMANVVVHAYHDRDLGTLQLAADLFESVLVIAVSDDGTGMRADLDSSGAGMGLGLIADLSSSMEIHSGDSGTQLVMRFARTG